MKKYYIKLTEHERSQIIHSLIDKNNAFMAKSRYTDAVGEVILKLMKAKKKADIDYWGRVANCYVYYIIASAISLIVIVFFL